MAEMHFEVEVDGRSSGRSAAASAAYRSGQKIKCVITGKTFDYSYRKGVEETLILGPLDRFEDEEAAAVRERNKGREPEQPKPSQPRKSDDPTPGM